MLEDNQVTLSTMKASRYMKAFEKEIDKWERTLSHILEVVEMILQVQRQWMYLEVSLVRENRGMLNGSKIGTLEHLYWGRHSKAASKGVYGL